MSTYTYLGATITLPTDGHIILSLVEPADGRTSTVDLTEYSAMLLHAAAGQDAREVFGPEDQMDFGDLSVPDDAIFELDGQVLSMDQALELLALGLIDTLVAAVSGTPETTLPA